MSVTNANNLPVPLAGHPTSSDSSVAKHDTFQPQLADDGTASIRDNTRLADLGYRPELRRDFSALETFGVAFSIM